MLKIQGRQKQGKWRNYKLVKFLAISQCSRRRCWRSEKCNLCGASHFLTSLLFFLFFLFLSECYVCRLRGDVQCGIWFWRVLISRTSPLRHRHSGKTTANRVRVGGATMLEGGCVQPMSVRESILGSALRDYINFVVRVEAVVASVLFHDCMWFQRLFRVFPCCFTSALDEEKNVNPRKCFFRIRTTYWWNWIRN